MRLYYVAARTRPDILTACSYASVVTEPTESDDMRLNPKYRLFKYSHFSLNQGEILRMSGQDNELIQIARSYIGGEFIVVDVELLLVDDEQIIDTINYFR